MKKKNRYYVNLITAAALAVSVFTGGASEAYAINTISVIPLVPTSTASTSGSGYGSNDPLISGLGAGASSQNTGADTSKEDSNTGLGTEKTGTDNTASVHEALSVLGTSALGSIKSTETTDENNSEDTEDDQIQTAKDAFDVSAGAGAGTLFGRKTEEEYIAAREAMEGANWGYTNLGISNVSDNLNIRALPGEDGKLVGKLPKNAACEVLEEEGDWTHITSGEVDGYVKSEYLLTGLQAKTRVREFVTDIVKVGADGLNVREEPNTDSPVVTQVATGEILDYISTEGDWVAVMLDDETVYVSADYVEVTSELNTALTMTEVLYGEGVSDVRADLCNYALQFVGNPYVWGGVSLTKGADCSGFVLSVFKNYGVSLPHSSRAQANMGTKISLGEAKAGDLVFYGNGRRINHVAIYLGGGRVVHASNPRTGIRVSNVGYRTPVKVVRILQD
ncbi:MAG: C40 family peptidase [Lachnospiraceae bacterium]|nr:C40 family peptidase [Lachnospiraceae bacterium]